jgi:hypothetical protein
MFLLIVSWWFFIKNMITLSLSIILWLVIARLENNLLMLKEKRKKLSSLKFFFLLILRIGIKLVRLSFIAFFSHLGRWENALVYFSSLFFLFCCFLLPTSLDNDRCHAIISNRQTGLCTTTTNRIQDARKANDNDDVDDDWSVLAGGNVVFCSCYY